MKFLSIIILFFSITSHAQTTGNFQPSGITGSAGYGFVHFDVKDPNSQNLDLKQGVYASIGGEKAFDFLNLYLTINLNYLKTTGSAKYKYTDTDGTYTSNNLADLNLDLFQAGLGVKWRIIDKSWFRPYVEGGGLFGYFQLEYQNLNQGTTLTGPNTNFPTRDSIFDIGYYAEGGLEISFSKTFGIKAAYRETWDKTKMVETLGNSEVSYKSQVYFLSLLKEF